MSAELMQSVKPVSEEQISAIIGKAFGKQTEIAYCQQMNGGHFNTLYNIRTLNPDQHIVLRVAPESSRPLLRYERTMMLVEPIIYETLAKAGVPTVNVLAVDGSKTIIDRDYIIVDYINGVPMNDKSVPDEVKPQIWREVGRYTAMMHGITNDYFGRITPDGSVGGSRSWADVFSGIMDEAFTKCIEAGVISEEVAKTAFDCFEKHRAAFDDCRTPALVHNDIWDPNIMVREIDGQWRIEAIIDADRALFADREYEYILWDNPNKDLLAGYGKQPDLSPNALIRKKFYRLQLYIQYAWFYLVMTPSPGFQAEAKKIGLQTLQELIDNNLS